MRRLLKRFWGWLNEPSAYDIWSKAYEKLQAEKETNGMSKKYWRIWHNEVCPTYGDLTEATPSFLRHPLTEDILEDMGKPISQRRHF